MPADFLSLRRDASRVSIAEKNASRFCIQVRAQRLPRLLKQWFDAHVETYRSGPRVKAAWTNFKHDVEGFVFLVYQVGEAGDNDSDGSVEFQRLQIVLDMIAGLDAMAALDCQRILW